MALGNLKDHVSQLDEHVREYVKQNLEYYELVTLRLITRASAKLLRWALIAFCASIFFALLSVAVAIFIGRQLHNYGLGFLIVACFFLLVMVVVMLFSKKFLRSQIINKISKELLEIKRRIYRI